MFCKTMNISRMKHYVRSQKEFDNLLLNATGKFVSPCNVRICKLQSEEVCSKDSTILLHITKKKLIISKKMQHFFCNFTWHKLLLLKVGKFRLPVEYTWVCPKVENILFCYVDFC